MIRWQFTLKLFMVFFCAVDIPGYKANEQNGIATVVTQGVRPIVSPAEKTVIKLTKQNGNSVSNNVLKKTVGVIGKPIEHLLSKTANVVENTVGGVVNILGNTVKSIGGIVKPGNPITGITNGAANIVNGIAQPVDNIVSSATHLVTGTVSEVLNKVGDQFKAIYPGTQWCGDGDRAEDINDLGLFYKTDTCCRSHDMCGINIVSGEVKYGLYNNGAFTKSHCQCDTDFYNCLKNTESIIASKIGITYFSLLSPQCFKLEYPATCIEYGKTLLHHQKCVKYALDTTQPKKWQWFDSINF